MEKFVEIKNKGEKLRGMFHIPENAQNLPCVILFHGFGGTKTEAHFMFVKLSRLLAKNGIASVRFDFRGSGDSEGKFEDMTILEEVSDAKIIYDFTANMKEINKNRIGIVGWSFGGAVGVILSGKMKERIKCLVLWSSAGDIGKIPKASFDFISTRGLLVGEKFYKELSNLSIYNYAKEYRGNVLIVHSKKDELVPLETALKYKDIYGKRAKLFLLEESDHAFRNVEWESRVLEETLKFLKSNL
ncbi:MAG: Hydrolase of the alpha/beta superfamily-like protein [Parcubacteria bacterium 32_520]|nr:MAG: Hydrolase of the alpha/beta superfamily-like protein [Parcubacteria bacterium 32_520]